MTNKKQSAGKATDSRNVTSIIPRQDQGSDLQPSDSEAKVRPSKAQPPPNNDLREAILGCLQHYREFADIAWSDVTDKVHTVEEYHVALKYLGEKHADEILALLKADRQRLLENLEIIHAKEIEECVRFTTQDVLNKLLAELPEKSPQSGLPMDRAFNSALDQCRKIIEHAKDT